MKFSTSVFSIPIASLVILAATGSLSLGQTRVVNKDKLPPDLVELAWAYAITIEKPPPLPEDDKKHGLPGTPLTFTRDEILGRVDGVMFQGPPADWYPGDHPKMPEIYAKGDPSRKIIACALCHYPNGKGKAENAPPGGQDHRYLVQQLRDMKAGLRNCADPRKSNYQLMVDTARGMTGEEIKACAKYFESIKWTKWIKVVETDTVPRTYLRGGLHIPIEGEGAGTEPIGKRIIESPVDPHGTEFLRNPRSGFVAWVPEGSLQRGAALVYGGGEGKTLQCIICHGPDLHGIGFISSIAARSPSYMARQINDLKQGTRHGEMAALMQPVVANLTSDDIRDIVAFLASLPAPEPESAKP